MRTFALILLFGVPVGLTFVYNFEVNIRPWNATEMQRILVYYGPVFLLLVSCSVLASLLLVERRRRPESKAA